MSRFAHLVLSAALISAAVPLTPRVFGDDTKLDAKTQSSSSGGTRTARHALDHAMPAIKFSETPLSEVMDYLQEASGANINVDWKALDAAHVAKDAPITMRISGNIPLRKMLSMILNQASGAGVLTYHVDQGVIEITSQEADDKVLYSRVYPIQDLLFQPQDATNVPNLSLQNASQNQTGGGGTSGSGGGGQGQGQGLFQDNSQGNNSSQQQANSQKEKTDEIIKLITDTVKPELWQVNGGTATISFFRGNLIVNAPRSIHEQLESE